jgi:Tfp pilus assembly protein PilF
MMNPILRPGLVLGLACLVPAVAGCHSLEEWKTRKSESGPDPAANSAAAPMIKGDPAKDRTEFHREVTPLQKFNVLVAVGRTQEAQEHYVEAALSYEKALEACQKHNPLFTGSAISPEQQALAHRRLGSALDHLGRFAQSEAHYREALKLSPNDPKVWNDAGYSCYIQGRWDDAIRDFKMAEKLDPGNPRVQTNLGLVFAATGKTDEALAALTRAGGEAAGHANLAFLMATQGKSDQARKHYQIALTLKPDLAPARQALAALDARDAKSQQLARLNAVPPANLPPIPPLSTPAAVARTATPASTPPIAARSATPASTPPVVARSATPASTSPVAAPSAIPAPVRPVAARPATTAPASPVVARPATPAQAPAPTAVARSVPAKPAIDPSVSRTSSAVVAKPQTPPPPVIYSTPATP